MAALDALRAACPSLHLVTDPALLDAASVDALRPFRGRPELEGVRRTPLAVAEPASTAETAALVRWANESRTPLVPRGGGSGLMGGAAVVRPAVVVSLVRLAAVEVDPDACAARAGAGATLAQVDAAAEPHGLACGHDPWTASVATVGGALGTNGLGFLGARTGSFGHQVLGLEGVLADGRVVRSRPSPARSTGFDWAALLVGTEGELGIVTHATLALVPRPEERIAMGFTLPSFEAGVDFAIRARRGGLRFTCLELSSNGLPPTGAALQLLVDGLRGEARLLADRLAELAHGLGGRPTPDEDATGWWDGRHAIAERWASAPRFREGDWLKETGRGHFDYAHVGVPVRALPAVRACAHALVREHDLSLIEEGLWHWPELYSIVVAGPAEAARAVRAAVDGVCRAVLEAGGTMEYCHGVGWHLAPLMEVEHGPDGMTALRRLKQALDPAGIMNPGKDV